MPKKLLNISNFSGGLNNNTNPRDLFDHELQILLNLSNEIPGKLIPIGSVVADTYSSAISDIDVLNYGNGLLHTNLDRNIGAASTIDENEYIFVNDTTDSIARIFNLTDAALESGTIDYGSTATKVEMYQMDGAIRVIPHYGNAGNTPKVYEYFNYSRDLGYSGATAANKNTLATQYKTSDLHIAPLHSEAYDANPQDPYNYEIEILHRKGGKFSAAKGSEITMISSNITSNITSDGELDQTAAEYDVFLAAYIPPGAAGTRQVDVSNGKGTMSFFACFPNKSTTDTTSTIGINLRKRYGFFASKVYSGYDSGTKSESPAVYIGEAPQHATATGVNQIMRFGFVGRMANKADKYSGLKIYWAEIDNFKAGVNNDEGNVGAKFLFAEVNFEKGIRLAGQDSYERFGEQTLNSVVQYTYPATVWQGGGDDQFMGESITTLPITEPYILEGPSVIGEANTGFKTSTIANRKIYAGNVQYYDKDHNLVTKSDRVLVSKSGQFDYFEELSYIDVEIEDGDKIISLASMGAKLLEFKRNKLFIINLSRGIEILEATFNHKGCEKDYHVLEGEGFVAWFNKHGAYLFDGEGVQDISMGETGQPKFSNWLTEVYHDDNVIGYLPDTKEILIGNKNGTMFKYDLKSESWTKGDNFLLLDISNMQNKNDGTLFWLQELAGVGGGADTVRLRKWNNTAASFNEGSNKNILKTKEFDFQSPSTHKNITTIYLNYKSGANLFIKGFSVKSDGVPAESNLGSSEQGLTNTVNSFRTQKIEVTSSDFKHILSFGLILYARGTVSADFVLNDIQIVYREKVQS